MSMRLASWWRSAPTSFKWLLGVGVVCMAVGTSGRVSAADTAIGSSDKDIVEFINQQIRTGWTDNEVQPAVAATDGEFCRRVFLDLIGRTPTLEEILAYVNDKSPDKKGKLVDKLLNDENYELELARNWTTLWTNVLIGRNGGNDRERPVSRAGMMQYVRTAFLKNKPYDKFVFELISANGNNSPGEKDYNGATNFVLDNLQEMQVPATNKVSQTFLGLRVGCTQCHNHPFNDWKQDQFWSMNAFFKQAKALRTFEGRDVVSAKLEDEDFAGEDNNVEQAAIYYELRNGLLKVAYPRFVDGTVISPAGYASEVNRRDELAKLVIKSPFMREAIVNRMWAHFYGYGFTKPFDDMGPHNPPSHPELLATVGNKFGEIGFDMRRLMKWCVMADAYSLSSKMSGTNVNDDPSKGESPLFSHFYIRQMSAEQLYESLMAATQVDKTGKTYEEQEKIKNTWLQQFTIAFGTDENDEATTFNGTIPQALMMMNGDLIQKATSSEKGSFLQTVASNNEKPGTKITNLYMAALGRAPTSAELSAANQLVGLRKGDPVAAMQDIWWALLNSNEFIINH